MSLPTKKMAATTRMTETAIFELGLWYPMRKRCPGHYAGGDRGIHQRNLHGNVCPPPQRKPSLYYSYVRAPSVLFLVQ